ncbi:MAG TPA: TonB-dependent receptor [Bacteroidota bacterium]|nr:TonB-dependent receptor [Bacteroidota bacterium]
MRFTILLSFLVFTGLLYGHDLPQKNNGSSESPSQPAPFSPSFHGAATEPGEPPSDENRTQFRVSVFDADGNLPIELARVALSKNGRYLVNAVTNPAGQARFRDIEPGRYEITAWFVGYDTFVDSIMIDREHTTYKVALHTLGSQKEVVVVGQREPTSSHINPMTANQVFESETFHAPPTARMTNVIQENLMGAVRAPTGEVHIRGQHGEFTYYVDGIPIPLGVFGGLNEVVDPKVIDRTTFITGGFPAEYGGQMSAIIDLNNRVPTGTFHLDASTYAGSYLTFNGTKSFSPGTLGTSASAGDTLGNRVGPFRALNSNGQNLSISDHLGKLGFFLSGSRQETDRRIDPPTSNIFNDHGFDYFLYGKFDYVLSDNEYLTANLNWGRTNTEVPYDSVEAIAADMQETSNSFQNVSYYKALNSDIDKESNLFIGGYAREGELIYTPGSIDPPNFQFAGDTVNYLLDEDRTFTTTGLRTTFDKRLAHEFMYKVGLNFSATSGKEDYTSKDSAQNLGPNSFVNFNGSDFGAFGEVEYHPVEWTMFELGARYDQHIAPDIPFQHQISPRIRWNFFIDENNTAYLYYGKLFMPTNIEGLKTIALNVSNTLVPTLPERDNFYEAVYTHGFDFGLRSKLAYFYKDATPGVDDETVGNSAIKTPVNIEEVKTQGIELGLTYNLPETPFSGFLNGALTHAYGTGLVSGGFLDYDTDGDGTDLDHDQRLSITTGLNYQPRDWFVNLIGIYGSGLANGNEDAVYKNGLFDFNTSAHTAPSWIFNISAGRTFHLEGGSSIEPSLYVTNVLDHQHLIKGAYFSGASWEEPRNVVFTLSYHM